MDPFGKSAETAESRWRRLADLVNALTTRGLRVRLALEGVELEVVGHG
jgi:hypothetical protein